MKIVKPSHEILSPTTKEEGMFILKQIELAARTCYQSQNRTNFKNDRSAIELTTMLRNNGHDAMLEFGNIAVKFIMDRGCSHELVRHRIASYAQESTRYVAYKEGLDVICPDEIANDEESFKQWCAAIEAAEKSYNNLMLMGNKPQIARSVLPTCLKTEICVSANIREWRNIFKLRTAKNAHPQIRQIMTPLLEELKEIIPVVFDDITATAI